MLRCCGTPSRSSRNESEGNGFESAVFAKSSGSNAPRLLMKLMTFFRLSIPRLHQFQLHTAAQNAGGLEDRIKLNLVVVRVENAV
jgi:hypothetical protein